jgi:hypothetical protein
VERSDDVPSVDVVLLRVFQGGQAVPVSGCTPVDLAAPGPPNEDVLHALLDSSVQLTVSGDMHTDVVRAIAATPVPQLFQSSPWLYEHKVLQFADGRCVVGGHMLRYHDRIGLLQEDADALS